MQRLGRLERAHSAEQQNLRIRIPQMRDSIEAMRTVRTLSTAPSAHFTIGKESTPSLPGGREIWGPLPPGAVATGRWRRLVTGRRRALSAGSSGWG